MTEPTTATPDGVEVVDGEIVEDGAVVVAGSVTVALSTVDVWDIDAATKGLRASLTERVRLAADAERAERVSMLGPDTVPGEADIAPLVRRLDDAASVFDRIGTDFKEVAKACRQEIGEDAAATGKPRVAIPHGDYSIVAKPKVKTTTTWDDDGVAGVIADLIVNDDDGSAAEKIAVRTVTGTDAGPALPAVTAAAAEAYAAGLRAGAVAGVHKSRELSTKAEWKVSVLDGLRKHLMRSGRDAVAGVLERARTVKNEPTDEWDVTRDSGVRRT